MTTVRIELKILIHSLQRHKLDSINNIQEETIQTCLKTFLTKSNSGTSNCTTKTNLMQICINSLRDLKFMAKSNSQCKALRKDLKLLAWFHLEMQHNLISLWDLIQDQLRLRMNSKISMEFWSQVGIEAVLQIAEIIWEHLKIKSTGMMGTEEIRTTGLMTITKRKERAMERRKSITVMSTVDPMIRLIKECKAAH